MTQGADAQQGQQGQGQQGQQGQQGPLGYERARDELAEVVRRLEAGGTTLEESLALWERGEELARTCQAWLDGARERLDAARARTDGAPADDDADGTGPRGAEDA
ncbi:exodeoxyribonuclease VII small subunit [Vallicoccus soli]|uniref:Exodeoxyribonuclease 7 small subunit n=1 Tax=Vallicoccus soli TaxID=2339232 RepID=A0A3A3Z150_9ACTN|nr:exodeoxyribonuclease VII small subunit [Vallicoccus soli]RJK97980.1 exodeoxyribonuclease VII small subunit [Vallicoccus soli]